MSKFLSYPWAILFGLYMYIAFQVMYLIRFGSLNMEVQFIDLSILVVGILSVMIYVYFARKLTTKRRLLFVAFLIAVPFGYIGALGGGLLGFIGTIVFGIVPFAILIPLGYWIAKKINNKTETPIDDSPVA